MIPLREGVKEALVYCGIILAAIVFLLTYDYYFITKGHLKMATFELPKSLDDIQDPQPMPEDWYILRITEEPTLEDNRKKKDGLSEADGAGKNIVLQLVSESDISEYAGRGFKVWLPWPNETDKKTYTRDGMTYEDWKMNRLQQVAEAFAGTNQGGSEVSFTVGDRAMFYITQEIRDGKPGNNVDTFNNPPRRIEMF